MEETVAGHMDEGDVLGRISRAMVAGEAGMPLHKQLRGAIEAVIRDGDLRPGAMLPGERTLAQALGLSRVTVRKSIEQLVEEGFLHRRQGARTEVASRVEKLLSRLTSFSEDMTARGLEPGCIWISRQITRPSPAEMMALGLAGDSLVVRVKRIRTADGVPLAVETSTVPARFLPSPDLIGDSLYDALQSQGAMPQRAVQRMRSRPASPSDARHLDCDAGFPLLVIERRCFLGDDQIVEFSESRYRGDVYDFVLELRR